MHHVDGVTALKFARDRHSFALSDLARISDQQQLLSSLFTEATRAGVIADPIRLQQFLSAASAAVTVDRGFDLVRLAQELRGIRPSDVTFTTVPLSSMNYVTPTGQSAVLWNRARAAALFSWLKTDAGAVRPGRGHRARKPTRSGATSPRARTRRRADRGPGRLPLGRAAKPRQLCWSSPGAGKKLVVVSTDGIPPAPSGRRACRVRERCAARIGEWAAGRTGERVPARR